MAHEVRVPRLGWSMEEGVFVGWRKRDGDYVRAGEILFELEGEKASQEIEAVDGGILRIPPDAPKEGAVLKVGALLGYLVDVGETFEPRTADPAPSTTESTVSNVTIANSSSQEIRRHQDNPHSTPRARRAAADLGIDWRMIAGTGRGGRIRERDILSQSPSVPSGRSIPISRLRSTIAERMLRSTRETAPVTLTTRVDATGLVDWRNHLKDEALDEVIPSYTDLVVKLTALTLRDHPLLAGRWCGDRIEFPDEAGFHIGIAVDTPAGLLVPVLRNACLRSLTELAADSRYFVDSARQGRLQACDMEGGVFTITNLGAFGIDAFTPIINLPETAVLGLGAIRREPLVMDDGSIVARHIMTLSLTFDHRIVDGAPAAPFPTSSCPSRRDRRSEIRFSVKGLSSSKLLCHLHFRNHPS